MLKKFLLPNTGAGNSLVLVRIAVGLLIADQGTGVFNALQMKENVSWLTDIHFPLPHAMAYIGKYSELICGIFLIAGFLTRFSCVPLILTMSVVIFGMGNGHIFGEAQLPFLFLLLFVVFLIKGGGKWSVDHALFKS